jgi:hypothetical protein
LYTQEQVQKFVDNSKDKGYTDSQVWEAMTEAGIDKNMLKLALPEYISSVSTDSKSIPRSVKNIGILYYVAAGLTLLWALGLIFAGSFMSALLISQIPAFATFGTIVFIALGLFFVGLSILYYFLGKAIKVGENWARTVIIVFSFIGIVYGLLALVGGGWISGILGLLFNTAIIYLLMFSHDSKEYFSLS